MNQFPLLLTVVENAFRKTINVTFPFTKVYSTVYEYEAGLLLSVNRMCCSHVLILYLIKRFLNLLAIPLILLNFVNNIF